MPFDVFSQCAIASFTDKALFLGYLETYMVHHGGFSAAPNPTDPRGPNLAVCVCRLISGGHRFVANTPGGYDQDGRYVAELEMLHSLMEEDGWLGGKRPCMVQQDGRGRNIITPKPP